MEITKVYDTKYLDHTIRPLFVDDAMRYPWTWVSIGAGAYVRYIPERYVVELGHES
jgi:hypothetical protein